MNKKAIRKLKGMLKVMNVPQFTRELYRAAKKGYNQISHTQKAKIK